MRYPVKGFTLIELMVVIALFGILASLAIPSFTRSIQKSKADTEVSDLMRGLNYARLEAIDRGVTTRIRPKDASNVWTTDLAVYDGTGNGATVLRDVAGMNSGAAVGLNPVTSAIDFNNLGGLAAPGTAVVVTYVLGAERRTVTVCLNGRIVLGGSC